MMGMASSAAAADATQRICNSACRDDIYRALKLETVHFITLPVKKNAVPSEVRTTRETNQSILGLLISRLNKKSLTCYFYDGVLLEIRYFKVVSYSLDDFQRGIFPFSLPFQVPIGLKRLVEGREDETYFIYDLDFYSTRPKAQGG